MPEITRWETALETKLQGSPNDYQTAKDLWLSRLLDAFPIYGISINTDEIINNHIFVIDIINESTQQIRVVFAHPNYRGNDRSTSEARIWNSMITKMTRYLCQVRRERMALREVTESQIVDEETYYSIIAVGRLVRFFALEANSNELMDCSGTNGATYDVFQEKEQTRAMFWELSRNNSGLHSD
jgi:hypothetical protein